MILKDKKVDPTGWLVYPLRAHIKRLIKRIKSQQLWWNGWNAEGGRRKPFFGLSECGKSEMIAKTCEERAKKPKFSVTVARLGHLQMDIGEWKREKPAKKLVEWFFDDFINSPTIKPASLFIMLSEIFNYSVTTWCIKMHSLFGARSFFFGRVDGASWLVALFNVLAENIKSWNEKRENKFIRMDVFFISRRSGHRAKGRRRIYCNYEPSRLMLSQCVGMGPIVMHLHH